MVKLGCLSAKVITMLTKPPVRYDLSTKLEPSRRFVNLTGLQHTVVTDTQEEGVIPVLATWDDHDYAYDNAGAEFPCAAQSRAEWAAHFNITLDSEQPGVYRWPGVGGARVT